MKMFTRLALPALLALAAPQAVAQDAAAASAKPAFDAELAKKTGADERGMRSYVLVILRTGPTRVPDGDERKAMFAGHMANIQRLSNAGKLVLAGYVDPHWPNVALQTQRVMDACLASARSDGRPVAVAE